MRPALPNEVFLASAHACLLLVIVGLAGAARRVQSYPLAAAGLAGLVPAEALKGLSEVGHPVPAPLRLLTAAALAALFGALAPSIAARARLAGWFAAGLSVLWALGGVVIGVRTSAADAVSGAGGVSGVLLIALGCAGLWRLAVRPAKPDAAVVDRLGGVLAMIAAVGASLSAVALAGHGGDRGLTLLTLGVTCAGSGLLVCSRHRALTLGFGLGTQMGALLYGPLCSPWSSEGIAFQLSGVCLLLAAAAASWTTLRQATSALSAVSLLLAAAVGSIGRHDPLAWFAIGTAAAIGVIIGIAAMRASRTEEITLGIVALAACWIPLDAAAIAARHGHGHPLLAVLTIYGAALLVSSTAPGRSWVVQPAAIVLALAAIDLAALRHITAPEAYSMPLAAAVAITGYVMWRRNRSASSWLISGPALVIALGPSTVVSLHDTGLTRIASTLAAAVTLALAGIALRAAAPLVVGCVSAAAVAIAQLAPYAAGTPRWMTLGLAGIALLALGIGFEQARSGARAAGRWVGELR